MAFCHDHTLDAISTHFYGDTQSTTGLFTSLLNQYR
jgi:phage tail protein X